MDDKNTTMIRAPKLTLGPLDPYTLRCKGQYPMTGLPTNKHDLLLVLGIKHHPMRQVVLKYPTGMRFEHGELNLDTIIYP